MNIFGTVTAASGFWSFGTSLKLAAAVILSIVTTEVKLTPFWVVEIGAETDLLKVA